jgi:hypothetical protein
MDELDRFFRHLVRHLSAAAPERLRRPVQVSELYQRIVPYRTHRTELGFDAIQDYEMTLLRLLAGERGYVTVSPPDVQEALAGELRSVNPNSGAFRDYAAAMVALAPQAVAAVLNENARYAPPGGVGTDAVRGSDSASDGPTRATAAPFAEIVPPEPATATPDVPTEARPSARFTLEEAPLAPPEVGRCPACTGVLPVGRTVAFCPYCGRRLAQVSCASCGAKVELTWRFCIACGEQVPGV